MKRLTALLTTTALLTGLAVSARAHCEIPCGIYTDEMRIAMILEDCTTIEKSMAQIKALSNGSDANQLVRWVTNKETHASRIQEVVTQYFLTQRIKPDADAYHHKLELLHGMLVTSMKCKQTTDPAHVARLRDLVSQFKTAYWGPEEGHAHGEDTHDGHNH